MLSLVEAFIGFFSRIYITTILKQSMEIKVCPLPQTYLKFSADLYISNAESEIRRKPPQPTIPN